MANKKVSELPAITSVQDADLLPVAASGTSYKATRLQLLTAGEVTGANGNNITITGGDGQGVDKDGGNIVLVTGGGTGNGNGGDLTVVLAAATGSGRDGVVSASDSDGILTFGYNAWWGGGGVLGINYVGAAGGGLVIDASGLYGAQLTQITTAQSGTGIGIQASDAVTGSSVVGAAAGGRVFIESGAAKRNTSGNADGGAIEILLGNGIGSGSAGNFYVQRTTKRLAVVPSLNQISLGSDQSFGWSSTTDATVAIDTGLIRLGAASVKITDGAAGTGSLTANIDAANVNSGTLNTARLGSGVADNTKFLRGDSTWQPFTTGTVTNVSATLPVTSTGGATPDIGFNNSNILAQQWFGG